jgi:hypothetical protein
VCLHEEAIPGLRDLDQAADILEPPTEASQRPYGEKALPFVYRFREPKTIQFDLFVLDIKCPHFYKLRKKTEI